MRAISVRIVEFGGFDAAKRINRHPALAGNIAEPLPTDSFYARMARGFMYRGHDAKVAANTAGMDYLFVSVAGR